MSNNSNSNTNDTNTITLALDVLGDAIEVVERAYNGAAIEAAARDLGAAAAQMQVSVLRASNALNEGLIGALEDSGLIGKAAELVRQTKELKAPWARLVRRAEASNARLEARLGHLAGIFRRESESVIPHDVAEKDIELQRRAQRLALKIQGIDPDAFEREFAGFESEAI